MTADTLSKWWPKLAGVSAADVTEDLYEWAAPVDRTELAGKYALLEAAMSVSIPSGKHAPAARAAKSAAVGAAFEALLRVLFNPTGALSVKTNVRTTTNEIDLLVTIHPSGGPIPLLRSIGTHFICEAKCHTKAPNSELVNEVVGFLKTHGSTFAILFVFCTSRSVHRDARIAIALHSQSGISIVPMGRKQLQQIGKGAAFLRVLTEQHVVAANHLVQMAI